MSESTADKLLAIADKATASFVDEDDTDKKIDQLCDTAAAVVKQRGGFPVEGGVWTENERQAEQRRRHRQAATDNK